MSRSKHTVVCITAALALCLVALPLVSKGQQVTIDSQGRARVTVPRSASSPTPSLLKGDTAIRAGTEVIYSNFGSGYAYNPDSGWTEDGPDISSPYYLQAMAFTPTTGDYQLTQLDLAIGWISGTNGYKLYLDEDNRGVPGKEIAEWDVTGLYTFGTCCSVETIKVQTDTLHGKILLLQGVQYWLVPIVNSNEWAAWDLNSVSASGNGALSTDGGKIWTMLPYDAPGSPNGAFDVLGRNVLSPPE